MSCQSCVFFTNENFMGVGQCWRYPPTPIAFVSGNGSGSLITTEIKTRYPEVNGKHWCGEFQSKDS
jgi:hypothetical protein